VGKWGEAPGEGRVLSESVGSMELPVLAQLAFGGLHHIKTFFSFSLMPSVRAS